MLTLHERRMIAGALRMAAAQTDQARKHSSDPDASVASGNELFMLKLADEQRSIAADIDDDDAVVTLIPGTRRRLR